MLNKQQVVCVKFVTRDGADNLRLTFRPLGPRIVVYVGQSFFYNETVVPAPNLPNKSYAGESRVTADTVATCDSFDSHVALIIRIKGLYCYYHMT